MFAKKFTAVAMIVTAVAGFSGTVHAQEGTQDDFMLIFKMVTMDKNKDGMVSKQEFMAMMEKAYDMKAKKMGAKEGMITEAQMKEFLKSLYYVGG